MTSESRVQSVGVVINAEWRALWRTGGIRIGVLISAAFGASTGIASFLIIAGIAREPDPVVLLGPIQAAAAVFLLVFGLAITVAVGRDASGRLAFSLLRVTRRSRLFSARLTAIVLSGVTGTVASMLFVVIVEAFVYRAWAPTWVGLVAAALCAGAVAGALAPAFAFGLSTVLHRTVPSILAYIALLIVLPLALAVSGMMLPAFIGDFATLLSEWTPAPLLFRALNTSSLRIGGVGSVVAGIAGLLTWAAAVNAAAAVVFSRRDIS